MRSIRTKITLISTISIVLAIFVTTLVSCIYLSNFGHESVEQSLALSCEDGKNNLNYYFKSVEQSVNTVSKLIDADLDDIDDAHYNEQFTAHMAEARTIFNAAAKNTNGVFTYYYRIDPSISDITNEKGFWYVDLDGKGFVEHEVTDISDDQNECVWFYEPKKSGQPLWLEPYVTDNLDEIVISYNVPVYRHSSFVGVVGIEISYHTLGAQIRDIKVLKSGFAYIIENKQGSIIYHPYIDILSMSESERPSIPSGFLDSFLKNEHHMAYQFQGVNKHAYWLELSNNMSIVVAVPTSEINDTWAKMVWQVALVSVGTVVVLGAVAIIFSTQFTKPLKELTLAAEQINVGDYNVEFTRHGNDEIGTLTDAMERLVGHLGGYIKDLNNLAYSDALTSVKNKSSFDKAVEKLQERIDNRENIEFAIAMLDCDGLKDINDKYGHDKGNVYLKNASTLMCLVFSHSAVYRIGGDEFAIILTGEDFENREQLKKSFFRQCADFSAFAKEGWERVEVSLGIAVYDPETDAKAEDVLVRADHLMYDNKHNRKKKAHK